MYTGRVSTNGLPTRSVPVNSSSEYRKTSSVLAMMPGVARGSEIGVERLEPGCAQVDGGLFQSLGHRLEDRRHGPDRKDQCPHHVDQDHASKLPAQIHPIEERRGVHEHRELGKRLRQQEDHEDQRLERDRQARQHIRQGNRDHQGEHRDHDGDEKAVLERAQHIPLQHLGPIEETYLLRKEMRPVPLLGEGPDHQTGERQEDHRPRQHHPRHPERPLNHVEALSGQHSAFSRRPGVVADC